MNFLFLDSLNAVVQVFIKIQRHVRFSFNLGIKEILMILICVINIDFDINFELYIEYKFMEH